MDQRSDTPSDHIRRANRISELNLKTCMCIAKRVCKYDQQKQSRKYKPNTIWAPWYDKSGLKFILRLRSKYSRRDLINNAPNLTEL